MLAACSTVLGIQDLESSGDGAGGTSAGLGGSSSSNGGSGGGTSTGSGGQSGIQGGMSQGSGGSKSSGGALSVDAGAGGEETGAGGAVSGGKSSRGGSGSGGKANDTKSVHGVVIDAVGQPVADAPVTVDGTTVTTQADGTFELSDVAATYDISVVVSPTVSGSPGKYYWLYQGLTRRDPTLQVYYGVDTREGPLSYTITNGSFETGLRTDIAFGSSSGSFTLAERSMATQQTIVNWSGPEQVSGRAHALRWSVGATKAPTGYKAYKDSPLALSSRAGDSAQLSLNLADSTVTAGEVKGNAGTMAANRQNFMFVRFASHAFISLFSEANVGGDFAYLAPSLPDSVITLAVAQTSAQGGYSLAHKDLTPGGPLATLSVPDAPLLSSPAMNEEGVNANTQFSFSASTTGKVFLFRVDDYDANGGVFVLTTQKQLKIPLFEAKFPLRSGGAQYTWDVQVNGDFATTDAATGANGFQDSFAARYTLLGRTEPSGSLRGAGTFSVSQTRGFKTE